ncbi:hypothetical protein [Gramella sp. AN32]|uniref:DUF1565 domain-containing protein n=1 Tax=Christiangramia antarctica TaxID=2058158 RepID=A0ABW5X2M7_9FLAO|nr:hypothetical protein [Gramella sp. AN32]MCM4156952.1 hypothetical protein [Gramella sp. AN32]
MKYSVLILFLILANPLFSKEIFISPIGNDTGAGTKESPYATIPRVLEEVKKLAGKEAVRVWFSEGSYYLDKTIELSSDYSGTPTKPVVFSALPGAKVSIKGSRRFENLHWSTYKEDIYVTQLPEGLVFDQLFINNNKQVRARFPNYDYQNPLRDSNGYHQVTDGTNQRYDKWFSFEPKSFTDKEWSNPETGIVHAFQSHNWGNLQYRIKEINRKEHKIYLDEGGWQLQRSYGIGGKGSKSSFYFIENIFEELDVAREWFLDTQSNLLYYYPPAGVKLSEAVVEIPVLKDLIHLKGTSQAPVKNIHFRGFQFTHATYKNQ